MTDVDFSNAKRGPVIKREEIVESVVLFSKKDHRRNVCLWCRKVVPEGEEQNHIHIGRF